MNPGPSSAAAPQQRLHVANFLISCALLALLFSIAILLFNPESAGSEKTVPEIPLHPWLRFSFLPKPSVRGKRYSRSGPGAGALSARRSFRSLLPLAIIWFFLSLLGPFFPPHGLLFIFAITTGVIASTMYTWVTMFDTFGPYACLPVAVMHIDLKQTYDVWDSPGDTGPSSSRLLRSCHLGKRHISFLP